MSGFKGYYSLMQFCPNPARLEAVNVGVVLYCPELKFLDSQVTDSNERVRRVFRQPEVSLAEVESAKRAMQKRLDLEQFAIRGPEALLKFIETRSNAVTLSPLRPIKVGDPKADLQRLFDELVGRPEKHGSRKAVIPGLDRMFERLIERGLAERNRTVEIPVLDQKFKCPYAYQNGKLNLVKPQQFAAEEDSALRVASSLAVKGSLFQRHSNDTRLVVVSAFATRAAEHALEDHVVGLLNDFGVATVRRREVPEFLARVEREAHAP